MIKILLMIILSINNLDKTKLQKELDYQVKATKEFQSITMASVNEKISSKAESKRQEAEQAKQEDKAERARALEQEAEKWETGGAYRQGVDAITNAVGLALGGSPIEGVAVGAVSPYVNTVIKEATKDSQTANILAHAIWEASATSDSSSLAVAQNTQAGMQVAKNAVENNYLSNWQKTLRDKQLQECNGNIRCKLNTQLYWSSVDVEQDASFGTGVVASIPEGAIETFEGIANFAAHPIDTLNALSTLVKEGKLTETVKQSYLQRIDNLKTQYEKAGVSEAYNAGVETGKLLQETVGVLAGGAGVAKAGSKVVKELGSVAKSTISKNVSANNKLPVVGKTTGYENQTVKLSGGEYRANLYSQNWKSASLSKAIDKFAGENPNVTITEKGKRIYENTVTKVQVVEDLNGKYFRIFDPNIKGKRSYLDLNGNVPSNKVLDNGKVIGRSQGEYNQVTHFKIGE